MLAPGPAFSSFLQSLKLPELPFQAISSLDPFKDPEKVQLLNTFCSKFYTKAADRILVLGINPGRKGGGLTGIPFTDPVALAYECGITHRLKMEQELSSTFIYEMITAFGGPKKFYDRVLLSAVCPEGFVRAGKNLNYYDDAALLDTLWPFLETVFQFQSSLGIKRSAVISLGKANGAIIEKLNRKTDYFKRVIILEHPRYIMQYKRRFVRDYVEKYSDTIGSLT